jgi:ABC-type amino acid transport substrate-binding protein
MKNQLNPSTFLALVSLLFFSVHSIAGTALEWCVDDIPLRHEFVGDSLQGPTVTFMKTVADRAGFTLTHTTDTPFQRCLKMMQNGQTDLMMGIVKNADRASYMEFIPVYKSRSESLFMRQESVHDFHTNSDIATLKLAKVKGYVMNTPDWPALVENNTIMEINNVDDGLAMLFHDHTDVLVSPHYSTLVRISHNPRFENQIAVSPIKLRDSTEKYVYLAFSKHADISKVLRKKTASVIANMVKNKETEALLFKPLKRLP